jgi:hypothetical protein
LKTHSLRSKQQPAESLLVNVNHTGSSELARPRVERQELSLAAQNRTRTSGDKLPPDFLGTAAYLLVAEKMSLGPELLEAALWCYWFSRTHAVKGRVGAPSNQPIACYSRTGDVAKQIVDGANKHEGNYCNQRVDR